MNEFSYKGAEFTVYMCEESPGSDMSINIVHKNCHVSFSHDKRELNIVK